LVRWIGQNPLAGAFNSLTLSVYEALAVNLGVGEKEACAAFRLAGFAVSNAGVLCLVSRDI
jgi:hypothetical protein